KVVGPIKGPVGAADAPPLRPGALILATEERLRSTSHARRSQQAAQERATRPRRRADEIREAWAAHPAILPRPAINADPIPSARSHAPDDAGRPDRFITIDRWWPRG